MNFGLPITQPSLKFWATISTHTVTSFRASVIFPSVRPAATTILLLGRNSVLNNKTMEPVYVFFGEPKLSDFIDEISPVVVRYLLVRILTECGSLVDDGRVCHLHT